MTRRRWIVLSVIVAVVVVASLIGGAIVATRSGSSSGPTTSNAIPFPTSMASVGDSITRAFDLNDKHFLQDDPEESWSTGTDTAVNSHYNRILAAQPAIAGQVYNDAHTGATMADLDAQLRTAAEQRVGYVTVLMGANDVCTQSVDAMTPVATFEAQFRLALSDFFAADPEAHVFVSSIPDIYQLWNNLHTNSTARITWALGHICQSMLAPSATESIRQSVVVREQADNAALAAVCRARPQCRFDDGAVYQAQFAADDVSSVDYFHPSLSGQRKLAGVTWAAGYWPTSR